jgi:lipopolysaccharide export system protein LptA
MKNLTVNTKLYARFVLIIYLLLFVPLQVNAKNLKVINLQGDNIEFNDASKNISCSGNTRLNYNGYLLNTDVISLDLEKQLLRVPEEFTIKKPSQNIRAKNFVYDFSSYTGEASDVDINIARLHIQGSKIVFEPEKIVIKDASFTTCDLEEPHFKVSADQLDIYPLFGFFVSFDNRVHASFLPVPLWFPTYVYGTSKYSLLGSSTPIPDMGSSYVEGAFVKQRFGYFLSEKSSGTIDIGYAEKLGVLAGFTQAFIPDDSQLLHISYHYLEKDSFDGHISYTFDLFKQDNKIEDDDDFIAAMFSQMNDYGQIPQTNVSVLFQYREVISDSRVSYLPDVNIDFANYEIMPLTRISLSTGYGRIEEDSYLGAFNTSNRFKFDSDLKTNFFSSELFDISSNVFFRGNWYSTNANWLRFFVQASVGFNVPILKPRISLSKKINNSGESPFDFEKRWAMQTDEIGLTLEQDIFDTRFNVIADYSLEEKELRNFDFAMQIPFHCWQGTLTWKAVQKQFQFGFNIY